MTLKKTSPSPWWVAGCFAAINIGIYLVQIFQGLDPVNPSSTELIAWGGSLAPMTLNGEPWRLLTNTFLHVGALHLLANMSMLIMITPAACRRFGGVGFGLIYLMGGLLASLVSATWAAEHLYKTTFGGARLNLIVSVGASGAIMAICGALLAAWLGVAGLHADDENQNEQDAKFKRSLLQTIGLNVAMGIFIPGIDNAAHFGGLVAGFLLAVAVGGVPRTSQKFMPWLRRGLTVVASGLVLSIGISAANTPQAKELADTLKEEAATQEKEKTARATLEKIKKQAQAERAALPSLVDKTQASGQVVSSGEDGTAMVLSDDEKTAYVVNEYSNEFVVVDLVSGVIKTRIKGSQPQKVDRHCESHRKSFCSWTHGARAVALLPSGAQALVSGLEPDVVSVIDLATNKIIKTIPLKATPDTMVVHPDQTRVFMLDKISNTLSVIELKNLTPVATLSKPFKGYGRSAEFSGTLWFSPDGLKLYVPTPPERQVSVFDIRQNVPVALPPIVSHAQLIQPINRTKGKEARQALAFELSGHKNSQPTLSLLDETTLTPSSERKLCKDSIADFNFAIARDDQNRLLVASHGYHRDRPIVRISNWETGVVRGTYPVPSWPTQLQFSKDSQRLFVLTNQGKIATLDLLKHSDAMAEQDVLCLSKELL
jgi:rhomboid protease GluP